MEYGIVRLYYWRPVTAFSAVPPKNGGRVRGGHRNRALFSSCKATKHIASRRERRALCRQDLALGEATLRIRG